MKKVWKNIISFLDKYEFISFGKNNKTIILLTVLTIVGMIVGSISVGTINMDFLRQIDFLFLNDFKSRIGSSGLNIFISSFSSLFAYILIIETSTLSFWGVVFIPTLVIFKGLGLGITAGYLYLIYSLKGIAFYILVLLPGIFISSIAIILYSSESIKFSAKFAKTIFPKPNNENLWEAFKMHIRKSSHLLILILLSSAMDTCFMAMFSKFFEF